MRFRPRRSIGQLRHTLPELLAGAERLQYSVIIRPTPRRVDFIQLDDLDAATLEKVRPLALLIVKTSPNGNQAWLAVNTAHDKEFTRRVRKATGADLMASGAVRIAGSLNFKEKYAPDFPRVEMTYSNPGRPARSWKIWGLWRRPRFSLRRPFVLLTHAQAARGRDTRTPLPVRGLRTTAPLTAAAWTSVWCKTAYRWGKSVEEIAARLMEVSEKARQLAHSNPGYALVTARNAAAAEERNRGRA